MREVMKKQDEIDCSVGISTTFFNGNTELNTIKPECLVEMQLLSPVDSSKWLLKS